MTGAQLSDPTVSCSLKGTFLRPIVAAREPKTGNLPDPQVRASPLAPFDPSQAEQATVSPAAAAMLTPALGASLGWLERLSPTLREYGQMANRAAPLNAAMGRFMGGVVPGVAAGPIPVRIGEGALAPLAR